MGFSRFVTDIGPLILCHSTPSLTTTPPISSYFTTGENICQTCLGHSLRDERFALAAGVGSHQFNIGHHVGRIESFRNALRHTQTALRAGRSVLVHCEAGVHRTPTASALCLMFIQRCSFHDACVQVAGRRYVEIDRAVMPRYSKTLGRRTCGWMAWIRFLEQEAMLRPAPPGTIAVARNDHFVFPLQAPAQSESHHAVVAKTGADIESTRNVPINIRDAYPAVSAQAPSLIYRKAAPASAQTLAFRTTVGGVVMVSTSGRASTDQQKS